ncbi:ComEC/Rec2 family competence protein [Actinacidiphila sp. SB3-2]
MNGGRADADWAVRGSSRSVPTEAAAAHAREDYRFSRETAPDLRLVPVALAVWAGAVAGFCLAGWGAAVLAGVSVAAAAVLLAPKAWRRQCRCVTAAVLLLGLAAGGGAAALRAAEVLRGPVPHLARQYEDSTVELTVTSDPRLLPPKVRGSERTPGTVLFEAEVTRVTPRGIAADGNGGSAQDVRTPVLVILEQRNGPARNAEWLSLLPSTGLRAQARFATPVGKGLGRAPVQDIAAVLRVGGDEPPHIVRAPSFLQRNAGALRSGLRRAADGLGRDARGLLPGLVVGDTSRLPADLAEDFRTTDMAHLTAVSGSNLTIVLALLLGPPGTAQRAERRGLAPLLGLSLRGTATWGGLLTLAFVAVCRPDPSVLRAAACGALTLVALVTGRRRSLLPALAAAVLLLVLHDPWLAVDFGFLLSVLATGSLLTVAPGWSAALRRRGVPGRLAEPLAAACAAQAVCAPVVAVLDAHMSLVAVPCNLLAEFAVAPATVLGFATLAAAPWAMPLAKALAWTAGWPTSGVAAIARAGAGLPGADLAWPGGWWGGLSLAALTVVAVLCAVRLRVPRRPVLCAVLGLLLLLAVLRPAPLVRPLTGWPPAHWRFVACDVGQGDALVLATGEPGTAVVVDAGPDAESVDRCLRTLGVTSVQMVLLTHFHADHVTGLPGVLRGRSVGEVVTSPVDDPPEQATSVRALVRRHGIPLTAARAGERRRAGELAWTVLWPPESDTPALAGEEPGQDTAGRAVEEGANDASVTLYVRAPGLTLLLAGDLEPPSQRGLLSAYPALPPADVLKVAHHGSARQDAGLLARARPRLALVSCGAGNPYGHPAPSTLRALRAAGAAVARTDRNGAVAVTVPAPGAAPVFVTERGAAERPGGAPGPDAGPGTETGGGAGPLNGPLQPSSWTTSRRGTRRGARRRKPNPHGPDPTPYRSRQSRDPLNRQVGAQQHDECGRGGGAPPVQYTEDALVPGHGAGQSFADPPQQHRHDHQGERQPRPVGRHQQEAEPKLPERAGPHQHHHGRGTRHQPAGEAQQQAVPGAVLTTVAMTVVVPVAMALAVSVVVMAVMVGMACAQRAAEQQPARHGDDHPAQHGQPRKRHRRDLRAAEYERAEHQYPCGVGHRHRGADPQYRAEGVAGAGRRVGGHHGLAVAGGERVARAEYGGARQREQREAEAQPVTADEPGELLGQPVGSAPQHPRRVALFGAPAGAGPCIGAERRAAGAYGEGGRVLAARCGEEAVRIVGEAGGRGVCRGSGGAQPYAVAAGGDLAPAGTRGFAGAHAGRDAQRGGRRREVRGQFALQAQRGQPGLAGAALGGGATVRRGHRQDAPVGVDPRAMRRPCTGAPRPRGELGTGARLHLGRGDLGQVLDMVGAQEGGGEGDAVVGVHGEVPERMRGGGRRLRGPAHQGGDQHQQQHTATPSPAAPQPLTPHHAPDHRTTPCCRAPPGAAPGAAPGVAPGAEPHAAPGDPSRSSSPRACGESAGLRASAECAWARAGPSSPRECSMRERWYRNIAFL